MSDHDAQPDIVASTKFNAGRDRVWLPVIAIMVAGGLGFAWYSSERPIWVCERAIKDDLKAPSTYRRISAEGSGNFYIIVYDAANSFGIPIRGKGSCYIDPTGYARWGEYPTLD